MINGKAHLAEMAGNPLMLTIIAFLYSLPKYTLPDNRVEFYERCTQALLEEWDRSQQKNRANRYESHQKISVLNRIAFQHVSTKGIDDELVGEDLIHRMTREEMEASGLRKDEYPQMEKEILENSGLLQKIPPTDYRFPHRTFMEFFAASYIDKEKNAQDMLELYSSDPTKWREVLLLYLGLNKNKEYANCILKRLAEDFQLAMEKGEVLDIHLFSALTQCAVPDPHMAEHILNLAREILITRDNPVRVIVEELGYIAANPRWAYAQKAKDILLALLNQQVPDRVFQQVIFSLLHAGDKTLDHLILKNIKRMNLREFFAKLGAREKYFILKLFALDLPAVEKQNIIAGLKEAGHFEALGVLLLESKDETIREHAATALWTMSKLAGFYDFLDNTETGLLDAKTKACVDAKFKEWGWRWDSPRTELGKKLAILICYYVANRRAKNPGKKIKERLTQVDNRFRYLTTGFLVEKGIPFHTFNLTDSENNVTASKMGLQHYWRNPVNFSELRNNIYSTIIVIAMLSLLLLNIAATIGFFQYLLGFTANGFYMFFFDSFTVQVVFLQYVLSILFVYFFLLD